MGLPSRFQVPRIRLEILSAFVRAAMVQDAGTGPFSGTKDCFFPSKWDWSWNGIIKFT